MSKQMRTLKLLKQLIVVVTIVATVSTALASMLILPATTEVVKADFYQGMLVDLIRAVATLSVAFVGWLAIKVVNQGEGMAKMQEDITYIKQHCTKCKYDGK